MRRIPFHHESRQISDSTPLALLLALAGGFLDAYTFISRGGVFANAQTGNIVLVGISAASRDFNRMFLHLIPIVAFAAGVFITEFIKKYFKTARTIHWRQITILIECIIIIPVAFFPQSFDMAANILVSFVCAFQVDSFRKWHGHAFATTMCTGNLRTGTELLASAIQNRDRSLFIRGLVYYSIIIVFMLGAAAGCLLTINLSYKAILFSLIPLGSAFILMFLRDMPSAD